MPGGVSIATRSPSTSPSPAQPGRDGFDSLGEGLEVDRLATGQVGDGRVRSRRTDDGGRRTPMFPQPTASAPSDSGDVSLRGVVDHVLRRSRNQTSTVPATSASAMTR